MNLQMFKFLFLPGWISISSLLKNSLWIKGESKESRSVRLIRPPIAWPETDSLKNTCLILSKQILRIMNVYWLNRTFLKCKQYIKFCQQQANK